MSPPSEGAQLTLEKLRAEIAQARAQAEKANVETRYLQRPWYKKSTVLPPLAVIVVTLSGTVAGFATGFFQSKFDKLDADTKKAEMENEKVRLEAANLESKRSFLNQQIATLTKNNEDLEKIYRQQLGASSRLQKLYKEASAKAATGESFRLQAERELQQINAQVKTATDALEATKWHEGDVITIDVLDQKTGKPIKDVLFTMTGSLDALRNRWKGKWTFRPTTGFPYHYPLSKEDVVAGRAKITFYALGYEDGIAEIEAGAKNYILYLVPAAPKALPK